MIICSRNVIDCGPYYVAHTAQACRSSFQEEVPDTLHYLLTGAEFRKPMSSQAAHSAQT